VGAVVCSAEGAVVCSALCANIGHNDEITECFHLHQSKVCLQQFEGMIKSNEMRKRITPCNVLVLQVHSILCCRCWIDGVVPLLYRNASASVAQIFVVPCYWVLVS
jgi:hypothetical protein